MFWEQSRLDSDRSGSGSEGTRYDRHRLLRTGVPPLGRTNSPVGTLTDSRVPKPLPQQRNRPGP